ncbi:hypothetical protein AB0M54_26485 [Actinoplanes sp. NPDC051470]|uniref:hypothetical protein n=1 Tax=Actinoplanes sp. NPDC051470 TaxID=3157224 RepID=UPI003418599B
MNDDKRAVWPWLVLVIAVVFAASGGWFAYRKIAVKDPGIVACEAMAAGDRSYAGQEPDAKLTEPEYRKIRKVFADSRYDDIRDHGTKLIDVVWQAGQAGENNLVYLQPLATQLTGLQSACADQGIFINLRPVAAASSEPGIAACDDMFPAAGPITAPASTKECKGADGVTMLVTAMSCTDGRRLFQLIVPGGTQATSYGFGGDKPHPLSDGTYAAALTGCLD